MKANTKKKLKYGLYFLLGLMMVLMVTTIIYFTWILPLPVIEGKWKALAAMPWYYFWCYLYYAFTKRYTGWWKTLEE